MKWLLFLVPLIASAVTNTVINNTGELFVDSAGNRLNGSIYLSPSQSFTCVDGRSIRSNAAAYIPVVNGLFSVSVCPNDTANPINTYYIARISLFGAQGGSERTTCWTVPSGGPYTQPSILEGACTVTLQMVALSRLTAGGASNGDCLVFNGTIWLHGTCPSSPPFPFTITAQTSLTVTHNLNSLNVDVEVYDGSGNLDESWSGWRIVNANSVQITWASAFTGRGVVK